MTSSSTQEVFGEVPPQLPFLWSREIHRAYVLVAGDAEGSLDQTVVWGKHLIGSLGIPWRRRLRVEPKTQRGDQERAECKQDLTEGRPWLLLAQTVMDRCIRSPMTTFSRLSAAECQGDIRALPLASLIITARGTKQGAYARWEEET